MCWSFFYPTKFLSNANIIKSQNTPLIWIPLDQFLEFHWSKVGYRKFLWIYLLLQHYLKKNIHCCNILVLQAYKHNEMFHWLFCRNDQFAFAMEASTCQQPWHKQEQPTTFCFIWRWLFDHQRDPNSFTTQHYIPAGQRRPLGFEYRCTDGPCSCRPLVATISPCLRRRSW